MKTDFDNVLLITSDISEEVIINTSFHNNILHPFQIYTVTNVDLARNLINRKRIDVIIINVEENEEEISLETIKVLHRDYRDIPIVVVIYDINNAIHFFCEGVQDVYDRSKIASPSFVKTIQYAIIRIAKFNRSFQRQDFLLNAIVEGTSESVFVKDINGKYILVNQAVLDVANKRKEEILGQDDTAIYSSEHAKIIMDGDKKVINQQKTVSYYINVTTPDGINRVFDATKGPIKDEQGKILGIFGVSRDVTDKLANEKRLLESENRLKLLIDNSNDIILLLDSDKNIKLINDRFSKIIGWSKEEILSKSFNFFIHSVDKENQSSHFKDILVHPEKKVQHTTRLRTKDGEYLYFDVTYTNCIKVDGLNGIIVNATDITERLATENVLEQSISVLNSILESTSEGILVVNNEGEITVFNTSFKNLWSIPDEIITSKDDKALLDIVVKQLKYPELFLQKVMDLYAKPDEISFDVIEFTNGRIFERYSQPQKIDGTTVGRVWSFRDITDKFTAQQELILKDNAIANSISGMGLADLNGNIIYANDALGKIWGCESNKELIGKNLIDTFKGEKLPQTMNALKTIGYDKGEGIGKRMDGSYFDVEFSANVINDDKGNPKCIFGSFIDITERKAAVKEIIESRERFKLMFKKHDAIMLLIEAESGQIIDANFSAEKFYGYSIEELIQKNIDELNTSTPEDIAHERKQAAAEKKNYFNFNHQLANGNIRTVEVHSSPLFGSEKTVLFSIIFDVTEKLDLAKSLKESETLFRELAEHSPGGIILLDINHKYKYASSSTKKILGYRPEDYIGKDPVEMTHPDDLAYLLPKLADLVAHPGKVITAQYRFKHANGSWRWLESTFSNLLHIKNVHAIVINFQDITEKVKSEEQIIKLSRAVEHSFVSVVITDLEGIIEYVNPYFCNVTGYTIDEVIGKSTKILKSGYTDTFVYKNLWETIRSGNEWRGELTNKKKNGEIFWESISISPVFDKLGTIINFIAVKEDITERKNAEKVLQESYEKEKLLIQHLNTVREEERAKIAQEFHDEIGQHLTVLKMDISWLKKKITALGNDSVTDRLTGLQALLDETVNSFRRIFSNLRPALLDDAGLVAAMDWHIKEFEKNNGVKTNFIVHVINTSYTENINLTVFRILQESIKNIAKHANAKNVIISFTQEKKHLTLTIIDDGVGFDSKQIETKKTFGILEIKERIGILGGKFTVFSTPNQGTTIKVYIPI